MLLGIFQSEREFDRMDQQVRRTYLHVGPEEILLANMPEAIGINPESIRRSATCLKAAGAITGADSSLEFVRGELRTTLVLREEGDNVRITDPRQDEWGGFAGVYSRVDPA
jgi:hypothetical protein